MLGLGEHLFKGKCFDWIAAGAIRLAKKKTRHDQAETSGFRHPA